jgi:hypothetical protein
MEQDENHEKGPRWSWARNHMGNVSLHSKSAIFGEFQAALLSLQRMLLACLAMWCGTLLFLTSTVNDLALYCQQKLVIRRCQHTGLIQTDNFQH